MKGNLVEEQYKRISKKGLLTTRRPKKLWYINSGKKNKFVFAFVTVLGCSDKRLFYSSWRHNTIISTLAIETNIGDDWKYFNFWTGGHYSQLLRFRIEDIEIEYYIGPIPF